MRYYVHASAEVEPGAVIGDDTKIWRFAHVMSGARIGCSCVLGQCSFVASTVCIGDGCRIQNNVSLYDGVTLEPFVFVGPSAVFTNVRRPRAERLQGRISFQPTVVERGATIGANSTIVCGVRIGRYAFVAAGAVVHQDVPAFALVAGCPARVRAWVCKCGATVCTEPRPTSPSITCLACATRYSVTAAGIALDANDD